MPVPQENLSFVERASCPFLRMVQDVSLKQLFKTIVGRAMPVLQLRLNHLHINKFQRASDALSSTVFDRQSSQHHTC